MRATMAADRFLSMYGNKLWLTADAYIQRDHDFRRNIEGYYVCLLQFSKRWGRNKLLSGVLLSPRLRPRSYSDPREAPDATQEWTRVRKQETKKTEKMKIVEEVEEQMAEITIKEVGCLDDEIDAFDPDDNVDYFDADEVDPDCGLICRMGACGRIFPNGAAMSDHFEKEHPHP